MVADIQGTGSVRRYPGTTSANNDLPPGSPPCPAHCVPAAEQCCVPRSLWPVGRRDGTGQVVPANGVTRFWNSSWQPDKDLQSTPRLCLTALADSNGRV